MSLMGSLVTAASWVSVGGVDAIDLLGYTDAQMRAAIEEMIATDVPVKEPVG